MRSDFSDVPDVINILRQNRTLALSIAEAGQKYMAQFGTKEHEMKIAAAVFRLYASIILAARASMIKVKSSQERKIENLLRKAANVKLSTNSK